MGLNEVKKIQEQATGASLTADDLKRLCAPFPKNVLGVKINSLNEAKTKAMLVVYLQHTDVYNRLEEVDPAWAVSLVDEQVRGEYVSIRAKLTLRGVTRENSGEGRDPKSAASDAIKRAAMLFGVGRYLYDSERAWVEYDKSRDYYRTWTLDEFHAALRTGQSKTPTAESEAPKAGAPVPGVGSAQAPRPSIQSPRVAPKTRSRATVGEEIAAAAEKLQLPDAELHDWFAETCGKDVAKMSTLDMQAFLSKADVVQMDKFLSVLQAEMGRQGLV